MKDLKNNSLLIWRLIAKNFRSHPFRLTHRKKILGLNIENADKSMIIQNNTESFQILTVPAVDLDDKNVLCFNRDSPKSPTYRYIKEQAVWIHPLIKLKATNSRWKGPRERLNSSESVMNTTHYIGEFMVLFM